MPESEAPLSTPISCIHHGTHICAGGLEKLPAQALAKLGQQFFIGLVLLERSDQGLHRFHGI